MRVTVLALLPIALCAADAAAVRAGPFGGFSRDGDHYLRGRDQICAPVTDGRSAPVCSRADAGEIARKNFRRGTQERGASARFSARAAGTVIELYAAAGATPAIRWDAGDAVTRIDAVYADERGRLVAVEYQTRLGGRAVEEVVVFAVAPAAGAGVGEAGVSSTRADAKPTSRPRPAPPEHDEKAFAAAINKAERLARTRKHGEAEAAYRAALDVAPDHPEARFGIAAALARQGKRDGAIDELRAVAASAHPQAPVWLVEARTHADFKRLRTDPDFRRAVGLDRDPARPPTAYERLVGLGGKWEQAAIPCEEPRVHLALDRRPQRFTLTIQSRCRGGTDTTRLRGTWSSQGTNLTLVFPNTDTDDDDLTCRIELCRDSSGEDCLRCQPDRDLEFLLRVVRR